MECSFGIIPLRRVKKQWNTLLVKHNKGHWSFPKGHPEPSELPQQTAARELKEETGLTLKHFFPVEPLKEYYSYAHNGIFVEKSVVYYLAEVEGKLTLQTQELDEYRWVSFEEAEQLATFPEAKSIVQQAARSLNQHLRSG